MLYRTLGTIQPRRLPLLLSMTLSSNPGDNYASSYLRQVSIFDFTTFIAPGLKNCPIKESRRESRVSLRVESKRWRDRSQSAAVARGQIWYKTTDPAASRPQFVLLHPPSSSHSYFSSRLSSCLLRKLFVHSNCFFFLSSDDHVVFATLEC